MNIITITQDNILEEVIHSTIPVLLDFNASWCGPCKMMAPLISSLAKDCKNNLKVGSVNIDEQPLLAYTFRVSSVPFFALIDKGEVVAETLGFQSKESLLNNLGLNELLSETAKK